MGNIGFPELVVILLIVLIVFGGGKLPAIGDALGKSIRNFKRATSGEDEQQPPAATPADPTKTKT